MSHLKLGLSLVFAGIVVIFSIQNVAVVEIHFLFWTFALSVALLIFCVLAIGIIISWMLFSWFSCRRKPVKELTNSEP